ncbi:nitroreductase [Aquicoccus sp. SCR17]|nr:nitroreductase [Carideicomes alvinocaridis]
MIYDWRLYGRWCHGIGANKKQKQLESALIKSYHGFEKGLSLGSPRPGFGVDKIEYVKILSDEWITQYGFQGAVVPAISALSAYLEFNKRHEIYLPELEKWLSEKQEALKPPAGGTRHIKRCQILKEISSGPEGFFLSRHSVRSFSPEPVPLDDIRKAIKLAQKAPSVCNRQGSRVYCFQNAMDALKWQPGNRGFGDRASRALVVTADLQAFSGAGERNQCWIDGGMFAMSVIYALHALGYGTCPLAWSQRGHFDRKARHALGIPDSEVIIMMIAVGSLPEEFDVAFSQRLDIDGVLVER